MDDVQRLAQNLVEMNSILRDRSRKQRSGSS
jgi:hypothetical protein